MFFVFVSLFGLLLPDQGLEGLPMRIRGAKALEGLISWGSMSCFCCFGVVGALCGSKRSGEAMFLHTSNNGPGRFCLGQLRVDSFPILSDHSGFHTPFPLRVWKVRRIREKRLPSDRGASWSYRTPGGTGCFLFLFRLIHWISPGLGRFGVRALGFQEGTKTGTKPEHLPEHRGKDKPK